MDFRHITGVIMLNAGYLTSESDPLFTASAASGITSTNITNWNDAHSWGNHTLAGYLTTITKAMVETVLTGDISSHTHSQYLTSYTETDPIFTAWDKSTGITITESQISDLQNYLTSFTETDPIFVGHTTYNIANGTGFLKNNGSGVWSYDNNTYLTSESDPVFSASEAASITSTDTSNWDAAHTHISATNNPHGVTADQVGASPLGHTHDDRYYTETETGQLLLEKADVNHNHDELYSPLGHNHDDRYYTENEVDSALSGKSNVGHLHDDSIILNLKQTPY